MQDGQGQQGQPILSSSYQQFQQQRFVRQEQQAVQAQQAILSAGADSFSQKVMDTINALRKVSSDLAGAQKQLEAQIHAQQRQLVQMQQNIDNVIGQLQNTFKPGSAGSSYVQ
ncbi:hypothetical protein [Paenibacillus sp.]|uniref:hypothetical protein n=1 Tax=Paenibacillus sp. TaxID=58172 RepID=UPI002D258157|nr:hypothetical protein [Paenibacillus sp.]HZG57617.1 hypothetical protein [Paenibacillus sp.]